MEGIRGEELGGQRKSRVLFTLMLFSTNWVPVLSQKEAFASSPSSQKDWALGNEAHRAKTVSPRG